MNKTYYELMNQISQGDLYEGLLAYGLFNDNLPPFLTSKPFFDYCETNTPSFNNTKKERSYIYYENMRNINIPRALGIPNPMAYQILCKHLKENWDKILNHFKQNTEGDSHKRSRIHIRKLKDTKKLFEMNYKKYYIDGSPEPDLLIGKKYIVNADISTCFPSIYTHSLPWALVGKTTAKNDRDPNNWYNKLDKYVRNTTNGETQGLLIGPTSSNLLSEIVLTSIDFELRKNNWKYMRNVDDYACYVSSYEEGQQFLTELSEQLRTYKLMLNHKKTQIKPLPTGSTEQWVRKLNTYLQLHDEKKLDFNDVRALLDLSIQLMPSNNFNSAILNYTIKALSSKDFTDNASEYYIKTVFHLSVIYPYLIPLLEKYILKVFNVDTTKIKEFSQTIYNEGVNFHNYETVSYAIYFAIKFDFSIPQIDYKFLRNSNHCILFILGFLYAKHINYNSEVKEFKKLARKLNNNKEDIDQYWLFIYEALPKSHLKGDWKDLKENQVTFVHF
ncbi:RNA-directed DNA polymerase [Halobacillus sp. Marseille-Q1614]|uniref:RNA-directed DNA polymerase n=1 Tax=Halobacillus sp. Marseille-Q1614 TaxID=2709134 RepID=UPI001570A77D|nr:RNA-directed DNA polymerase [Halobacillus sp. Marseille-Q1614]